MSSSYPISPTQIKAVRRCEAYYAYKYVERLPDPASRGADFGSAIHKEVEDHLNGEAAATSQHAKLLLKNIPCDPDEVEFKFEFTFGGHSFGGKIDVLADLDDRVLVLDHKTSSNPRRWALTEEQLIEDPQAVIYAKAGIEEFGRDRAFLLWNYVSSGTSPYLIPVKALVRKGYVDEQLQKICDTDATTIVQLRTGREPIKAYKADPFTDACGAYGGCPYLKVCYGQVASEEKEMPKSLSLVEFEKPIGTLYIDCVRVGSQMPTAFDYLKTVRETFPNGDHRLVDYGKGAGELVSLVTEYLTAHPVEELSFSARTPWGSFLTEVLISLADEVVRGV